MKAVGYIRISKKDQSQNSLEYQARIVREYCVKHNLDLVEIFEDDGESSETFDRPDYIALEKFIKKNKGIDYLIIFDHDRFSRNTGEVLMKFKELEQKMHIQVRATTDRFDTDFTDPAEFMMRTFKYMMAENELMKIRLRTKEGLHQAAINGRFTSKAPWGYKNSRDANNKTLLAIDEDRAVIVRMIFREFNRGTTIKEIKKIVAPLGYNQTGRSAVQEMLANPLYAGMIRVPAHRGKPEQIIKAIHQGVVSEQEYWQAQHRLGSKTFVKQVNSDVPLRGLVKCPVCAKPMTAGNSKGSRKYYWYYVCHADKINLPGNKLHQQLNGILNLLSFEQRRIDWYSKKMSEEIVKMLGERGKIMAKTQKAFRETGEQIETVEVKYLMAADISPTVYKNTVAGLRKKQIELQQRMIELGTDQSEYWNKLNDVLPLLHDIRQTYETLDLNKKQQFLSLVFNSFLSHDGTSYRTKSLHPMFAHNVLTLKEKGLLIVEQPLYVSDQSPVSTGEQT